MAMVMLHDFQNNDHDKLSITGFSILHCDLPQLHLPRRRDHVLQLGLQQLAPQLPGMGLPLHLLLRIAGSRVLLLLVAQGLSR